MSPVFASPSAWNDFLPWLLLGVALFALLLWLALRSRPQQSGRAEDEAAAAAPPPDAEAPPPVRHASTRDIALLIFSGLGGAEHAFARVHGGPGEAWWLPEVAFVERHGHGRLVVRGTVAGRYLDLDDAHGDASTDGLLFDEIRSAVPEGSSALVALGATDEVDAMVEAFRESGGRLARHRVLEAEAAALEASVAEAPRAAPPAGPGTTKPNQRSTP